MGKIKNGILIFAAGVLCAGLLAGCAPGSGGRSVGFWSDGGTVVTLYDDGTFTYSGSGRWRAGDGDVVELTYAGGRARTLELGEITPDASAFENGCARKRAK